MKPTATSNLALDCRGIKIGFMNLASTFDPMHSPSWGRWAENSKLLSSLPANRNMQMPSLMSWTQMEKSSNIGSIDNIVGFLTIKCMSKISEWSTETPPKLCSLTMRLIPIAFSWKMESQFCPFMRARIMNWQLCKSTSRKSINVQMFGSWINKPSNCIIILNSQILNNWWRSSMWRTYPDLEKYFINDFFIFLSFLCFSFYQNQVSFVSRINF